ncbi:OmpA family protein [Methylobacterium goesingense]|uniref:OmpA family protein n=1 Tax=Methylobacterium goesingense TaxID=243690 RepID=UPI003634722A
MTVGIEMGLSMGPGAEPARLDLEELLATRLLVQGNSGSGKSHLLRRLLEQSAGAVQQVIIDPEGDFVTLAEAYGHVVVDGAHTEPDLQAIAARVRAHRVSVVLTLESLDMEAQMRAAAAFLGGLFEAERTHWHPALIVVDEAQIFAPAAAGDVSDEARKASLGAMTNLMCRGRKRGLAGIIATQRLAKLAKNVAAEATNFLMGRTFLDIDMARAADLLGLDRRGADDRREDRERRDAFERREPRTGFNAPGRPGYIPGGFRDDDDVRDYDQVRRDRREFSEGGRTYIREPGRIIVRDRDNYFIRHDENERFRDLDRRAYRSERRGGDTITYLDRPGGEQIVTIVDDDGRLVRRSRRFRDGREVVIIDNSFGGGARRPIYDDVVDLPPPDIRIPRNRYVVDYDGADEGAVYEALSAPPVVAVDRRYTLDQVRYSPQLRARMRSVDIDTINFDTGSFTVTPDQASRLATIAAAMNRAIKGNPQEVFLIEGYTDAVGADVDNLSLSDRRAQSVATVLTQNFGVPPENLTTQGYGEQNLKVNTQNASRENRRVTVRRITPLIQQQGEAAPPPAPAPR